MSAGDAALSFLTRHRGKLFAVLLLIALILSTVSLKPFQPSCGLPGYSFGSELDSEFLVAFLKHMYRLREAEEHSWTGIFLIKGERLYLLPWERQSALTAEASRLAVHDMVRWRLDHLPASSRLYIWYRLDQATEEAGQPDGSPQAEEAWCAVSERIAPVRIEAE
ncbi:hypothetical protein ABWI00_21940 [Algihabitans albus]|uniref:hypothetical protein n=1 Tax=Algihabitans albus TaxID=2164067 RepID=UPI0035CEDBF0